MENEKIQDTNVTTDDDVISSSLPDPDLLRYYRNVDARSYWLTGEIDEGCMNIVQEILNINREDNKIPVADREPIKLFVNSDGGDAFMCRTLMDVIRLSVTPIVGINIGKAASAAGLIFLSCPVRLAFPYSYIMLHDGSTEGMGGNYKDIKAFQRVWDEMNAQARSFVLEESRVSPDVFDSNMVTDWWISADDAVNTYYMVDEIVDNLDEVL